VQEEILVVVARETVQQIQMKPLRKGKKKAGNDARAEALEEARGMNEAVADNNGDDTSVTPPASPDRPRSSASERAKTLELNQAKDAAAKATAELERLKAQLEREKKKTAALHAAPPPPSQRKKIKPTAAMSRSRQVCHSIQF
jgi:hypothetical protein